MPRPSCAPQAVSICSYSCTTRMLPSNSCSSFCSPSPPLLVGHIPHSHPCVCWALHAPHHPHVGAANPTARRWATPQRCSQCVPERMGRGHCFALCWSEFTDEKQAEKTSRGPWVAEQAGCATAIYASGLPQIYIFVIMHCKEKKKKKEKANACPFLKSQSQRIADSSTKSP